MKKEKIDSLVFIQFDYFNFIIKYPAFNLNTIIYYYYFFKIPNNFSNYFHFFSLMVNFILIVIFVIVFLN